MTKGWEFRKIKEIGEVVSGATPKTNIKEYWDGEIVWVTPAEISMDNDNYIINDSRRRISIEGFKKTNLRLLPKGTVLLTTRAPIGKVAIAGVNLCTNQGFKNIICNNLVNNKYLFYFLKDKTVYLNDLGRGATFKEISKTIVEEMEIPLPPIKTQEQIVKALDKVQELINKRKEQILKLDEFLQSVFLDMFGDPVSNSKGWEKKKLGEISDIVTGNTPSRKEKGYYGDYIEWIKSDNINTPYHYLTDAEEYLSKKGLEKGRSIEKNSILMTCIAGSLGCIGNVALVNRRVAFNQQINGIVPKKINLHFLYCQLLLSKNYIQSASTNSMKGMLSKSKLSDVEFIVPPKENQIEFEKVFIKYLNQKEQMESSLAEMENLSNSIMQKAFKEVLFSN